MSTDTEVPPVPAEMPLRLACAVAVARENAAWLTMTRAWGTDPVPPPVIIPEQQRAEWKRLKDHPVFSADEQAAQDRRWLAGLRERMYEGTRKPDGWLTGTAPDPSERNRCSIWPGPAAADATELGAGATQPPPQGLSESGTIPPPAEDQPGPGPRGCDSIPRLPDPDEDEAAAQFGCPADEEFWPDEHPGIAPPPETTQTMTAVLPLPGQEQR